ncbi:hypothetical protein ELH26_29905 (plasmid) [Rhizobium leguminosarum]|uniref:Uncharacterized protein n=1 Tax=Rhizobium beringeri TaxID=3019934 RepID=A0ABY1XKT6_9HYPH|nr:hypothetical protein ELI43_28300 [Rhizobium leguminosarum]TBC66376.1 hypothetical protein ELH27_27565 [Rhizobium leguminosarum]TBC88489.1 hypothetical protein ELH26_29905 [Rhizobium leguminosarum]TBE60655.1 hypothetical protein ELH03_27745 [Rhizobium beringeri]
MNAVRYLRLHVYSSFKDPPSCNLLLLEQDSRFGMTTVSQTNDAPCAINSITHRASSSQGKSAEWRDESK